jgi:hypothetical protein
MEQEEDALQKELNISFGELWTSECQIGIWFIYQSCAYVTAYIR